MGKINDPQALDAAQHRATHFSPRRRFRAGPRARTKKTVRHAEALRGGAQLLAVRQDPSQSGPEHRGHFTVDQALKTGTEPELCALVSVLV